MMKMFALCAAMSGCGAKAAAVDPQAGTVAVGTYVGGGSVMMGPDRCTYTGGAGMFQDAPADIPPADRDRGPRFILAPGTIVQDCGGHRSTLTAVDPTGAALTGPTHVQLGATSEPFEAAFTAAGQPITGEGTLDWKLGAGCDGVATFAPVMGAQDTGRERTRRLIAQKAGSCTVLVTASTGSALYEKLAAKSFKAERTIRVD